MTPIVTDKNNKEHSATRIVDTGDGFIRLEGTADVRDSDIMAKSDVKHIFGKIEDAPRQQGRA